MEWDRALVQKMRDAGVSWENIGRVFGISDKTAHRKFDPEHNRRVRENNRRSRAQRKSDYVGLTYNATELFGHSTAARRQTDRDWQQLRELIPEDTRDLTARICGDPIPNDPRRAG